MSTIVVYMMTNVDNLNIRSGPSTKDEIISIISKGSEVEVLSESGGWSKIKYNKIGYVYSKYLSNKTTDIGSITTSISAEKILAYAKTLIGKPYVWADEGPNSFDCSGFTWYVFKNIFKISLPRASAEQGTYGIYVERKSLKPADLVFFDTVGVYDKKITHVGIYMGDNKFIHASSGQGKVVISDLTSTYYSKAFVNGRRVLK
ncbi:MAG: SH3 domain-containing C40 family peptidase [Terrisporobacter sp.]